MHQCRIAPKLCKFSLLQALLNENIDRTLLVGGENFGHTVRCVLPGQEHLLSNSNGEHAQLSQGRTSVCQSTCICPGVAIAAIFSLAYLEKQWVEALRLLP